MDYFFSIIKLFFSFFLFANSIFSSDSLEVPTKDYPNPQRYEEAILNYEKSDSLSFPPGNAIVCYGSSSMRGWHDSISVDLAPLTLIPRGFGGSNMNDALYYSERMILNYKPRAVLLYEGDNDIGDEIPPNKIINKFEQFISKVHKRLPKCRIYVLAIKPSLRRWHQRDQMRFANKLLEENCSKDERLEFIDIVSIMLNENGVPKEDIFLADSLHMNRKGYLLWRDAVRPIIVSQEEGFE